MVHKSYPFEKTTKSWGIHKLSKDPKQRKIQSEIVDLLYNVKTYKGQPVKDKEIMTITVLQTKNDFFKFLKAHTRWGVVGTWVSEESGNKFMDEKNSVVQIEFLDTPNEAVGKRLLELFNKYNKDYVKEESLYVRTEPVEESSLPLLEWR